MVRSTQTSENSHIFYNVPCTWYKSLTRAQLTYSSSSSSGLDTAAAAVAAARSGVQLLHQALHDSQSPLRRPQGCRII